MVDRILQPRLKNLRKSVLLLGARQVGKSTLIRSLNPSRTINLADERLFLSYSKDPSRLLRELRASHEKGMVAIDEVQRVPKLLDAVQIYVDEVPQVQFLLTGSSARKLRRGQANLLPGRIIMEYLDPLTLEEIGEGFDLERALQVGCLPGIYLDLETGIEVLDTYAQVYLREEIRAEALTREIGSYSRFLDLAAACSGQWINYSKMANDSEIPKETIRRFYSILEDTLLAFRIPPFQLKRSGRRVSHRDRFLLFDVGVRNALLGLHRSPLSPTEKGFQFEQWFILQSLYFSRAHRKGWQFSAYRTDAGAEVDLVIDTGNRLIAIECKLSRNISESDLRGLRSLEEVAHKPLRKYVVYQGDTRQKFSRGEIAVPFEEFLLEEITTF